MRGTHSNGAPHTCFWQRKLTGKQLLHGEKEEKKTAKTHAESAFGWALLGWAVGRSLIVCRNYKDIPQSTTNTLGEFPSQLGPDRKARSFLVGMLRDLSSLDMPVLYSKSVLTLYGFKPPFCITGHLSPILALSCSCIHQL